MQSCNSNSLVISGLGITSSIGQGCETFTERLLKGESRFGFMARSGRQVPEAEGGSAFIGAEIDQLALPDSLSKSQLRSASFAAQAALATLHEAWNDAELDDIESTRVGLVAGGSNFQQRDLISGYEKFRGKVAFVRPTYAMNFMDSDLCGLCSEAFGIRGFAYTLGGASASGQIAVIQAAQAVMCGEVDVCIALAPLMDLSYWECQGFRAVGAMGSNKFADAPELACRPFDIDHDGFIFGESCGAVVIERNETATKTYARLAGWSRIWDGNRNPNPSFDGERYVIQEALKKSALTPSDINYVNPHGTASVLGDETELKALKACGLGHVRLNTTKSIIGHGLCAAGIVELISTVLQMKRGQLHPSLNLETPIDDSFHFVRGEAEDFQIHNAINLSMGFGGVNSAVCISHI